MASRFRYAAAKAKRAEVIIRSSKIGNQLGKNRRSLKLVVRKREANYSRTSLFLVAYLLQQNFLYQQIYQHFLTVELVCSAEFVTVRMPRKRTLEA
ncbi:MAG: hypothetical protein ACM3NE_10835, partial [Hyphomicrobiales bacterium]